MQKINPSDLKSSESVIQSFSDILQEKVLKPGEELATEPSSFVGYLADFIGDLTASHFFEMMANKNEINASTAIKKRSLLRRLSSDELEGIYASPAVGIFIIGYEKSQLIEKAVDTGLGYSKLKINKDTEMAIGDYPSFVMDHDLDIYVTKSIGTDDYNIYGKFDVESSFSPNLSSINDPFVNTLISHNNDKEYVIFKIPMRQYSREYTSIEINTSEVNDINLNYENNLMGFEVLYRKNESSSFYKLNGYPEGEVSNDGYIYTIEEIGGIKQIKIHFKKGVDCFMPAVGSSIQVVVYTTEGENGNFEIKGKVDYENDLMIYPIFKDDFEIPLSPIKPVISVLSNETTSGYSEKSITDLKDILISRRNNTMVITPSDIEREAKKNNFIAEKVRFDITGLAYKFNTVLKNGKQIIPASNKSLRFIVEDIPKVSATGCRILTPKHVFRDVGNDKCVLVNDSEATLYMDYLDAYEKNDDMQMQFPFYLRVETNDIPSSEIFDLSLNKTVEPTYMYYNTASDVKISVLEAVLERNPMEDKIRGETGSRGQYSISFVLSTNETMIDIIEDEVADDDGNIIDGDINAFIKSYMVLRTKDSTSKNYITNTKIIGIDDNGIWFEAILVTDNGLTPQKGLINIIDNSIQPFPRVALPPSSSFLGVSDIEIYILVKTNRETIPTSPYDTVRTADDISNSYYISSVYRVDDVSFTNNITKQFRPIFDHKLTEPTYKVYDEDVYDYYTENVYEYDDIGNVVMIEEEITLPDNTTVTVSRQKILHNIGDPILDVDGNHVIKHSAGEYMVDVDGNKIVDVKPKNVCNMRNVPIYNRAFSYDYFMVRDSFYDVIERYINIEHYLIDGCIGSIGMLNTLGSGPYEFKNQKTGETKQLNNMALSFKFGVMFDDTPGLDTMYLRELIISEIEDYVNNFSGSTFSIHEMLDFVKKEVPNIKYFETYDVNDYGPGVCQTIKESEDTEGQWSTLCIKYTLDRSALDEDPDDIKFIPDIKLDILNGG